MNFFKNKHKPNDELNKVSKAKVSVKPSAVRNPGKEQTLERELQEVEDFRGQVLEAIAKQADLKAKQEAVMNKAQHQIDYNQAKVDAMQQKLKSMEDKYNLFHKRKKGL